jgi:hypothetical protein
MIYNYETVGQSVLLYTKVYVSCVCGKLAYLLFILLSDLDKVAKLSLLWDCIFE